MNLPHDQLDARIIACLSDGEAVNYVREQIQRTKRWLQERPSPVDVAVSSLEWQSWFRRMLIDYGRAMGRLEALQAFGKLVVEEFKCLHKELLGVMLRTSADAELGVPK